MLNKPQDIVIMLAIVIAVISTVGFGLESVAEQGADTGGTTFFSDVEGELTSTTGIKSTADESTDVLDPSGEPVTAEASEESIITQGLQSLRSLSASYKTVEKIGYSATNDLGIDPLYITLLTLVLIISLFIIIYTWARGR